MNRRAFLGTMFGGVVATAAVRTWPFRVYSFAPKIQLAKPMAVRFVRAYDVLQDKFIFRYDVLYGYMKLDEMPSLCLEMPRSVESADMIKGINGPLSENDVEFFLERTAKQYKIDSIPKEHLLRHDFSQATIVGCEVDSPRSYVTRILVDA